MGFFEFKVGVTAYLIFVVVVKESPLLQRCSCNKEGGRSLWTPRDRGSDPEYKRGYIDSNSFYDDLCNIVLLGI